jgi:hypothetical protein
MVEIVEEERDQWVESRIPERIQQDRIRISSPEHQHQTIIRLTFSSTSPDSDLVPRLEDPSILGDGMMHLCLEHFKEAGFAHLLTRLWPPNEGLVRLAKLTESGWHLAECLSGYMVFRLRFDRKVVGQPLYAGCRQKFNHDPLLRSRPRQKIGKGGLR